MSNKLLNKTMEVLDLKNDRHLAATVGVAPPVISKIRHGHLKVGAVLILRIHKLTRISVEDIEAMIGDKS
jgi:plasmid maintenance system antidote protein VapI